MLAGFGDIEELKPHVPALFTQWLAEDGALDPPVGKRIPSATLFVDICGFSDLARKVTAKRPSGVEELPALINSLFGEIVRHVRYHGGDVVKFAGDALLVLWPVDGDGMSTAIRRAVQCALAIRSALIDGASRAGYNLRVHVGIGAGDAHVMYLGGLDGQAQVLVAGEPIAQMSRAMETAADGEIAVSPQAWAHVQPHFVASVVRGGTAIVDIARGNVLPPQPLTPVSPPASAAARMASLLPKAMRAGLPSANPNWIAEIRRVSIVFINVTHVDYDAPGALATIHQVLHEIQAVLQRYEGALNQLVVDDKGTSALGVFGLPPEVHDDDATRAVVGATAIHRSLARIRIGSAIGVATGRVFCGPMGDETRCEYAVMGAPVNLASRLMVAAGEGVLCHAPTRAGADAHVRFASEDPLILKGSNVPVESFRPIDEEQAVGPSGPMVGRVPERARLHAALEQTRSGRGSTFIIRGEPGIGKSRLVEDLVAQARKLGIACLRGEADRFERAAPYRVWRSIFEAKIGVDPKDPEVSRLRILECVKRNPRLLRFVPLLNDVLPLDFPPNDKTRAMRGQVRADNTRALLLALLTSEGDLPPVIVLEDGQWFDSASWELCLALKRSAPACMLVVTMRPFTDDEARGYDGLASRDGTQEIRLDRLAPSEGLDLAAWHLEVDALDGDVADLIERKGVGNPLFIQLLASHLQDKNLVAVKAGRQRTAQSVRGAGDVNLPSKIEDVIKVRIADLSESQRTTLKVASVIGLEFSARVVRAVYPRGADSAALDDNLAELVRRHIIVHGQGFRDTATYAFKHVLIQEVAYNLMTYAQRRSVHLEVARWYESRPGRDHAPFYTLLAHHFLRAEEAATDPESKRRIGKKAVEYLEKAGVQAMRGYANREAVSFFDRALSLAHELSTDRDPLQRAHWERLVGEANLRLGHLPRSHDYLARSVALSDRRVPSGNVPMVLDALLQVGLMALQHLLSWWKLQTIAGRPREQVLESARAYEFLAEIHYFSNEPVRVLWTCLRALYLARKAGPSPELARLSANMSIVAGGIPLRRAADACVKVALETVQRIPDHYTLASVLTRISVYYVGIGDWDTARKHLVEGMAISERLNVRRLLGECTAVLANVEYHSGRFAASLELYAKVRDLANLSGDVQHHAWATDGLMENRLRLGGDDHADRVRRLALTELLQLTKNLDSSEELRATGLLALAEFRAGDLDQAWLRAKQGLELCGKWFPNFVAFEGHSAIAEVGLKLWQTGYGTFLPAGDGAVQALARAACRVLMRYAKHFAMGEPRAHLWQGIYYWRLGKVARAQRQWRKSLEASARLKMPYEAGLANLEIGLLMPHGSAERFRCLLAAEEQMAALDAAYDLARCVGASADADRRVGPSWSAQGGA